MDVDLEGSGQQVETETPTSGFGFVSARQKLAQDRSSKHASVTTSSSSSKQPTRQRSSKTGKSLGGRRRLQPANSLFGRKKTDTAKHPTPSNAFSGRVVTQAVETDKDRDPVFDDERLRGLDEYIVERVLGEIVEKVKDV